jgi:hypothetical protein
MWHIHTIEYYLALKRNKILSCGGHYIKGKKSDTERKVLHVLSHEEAIESKIVITRVWEEDTWEREVGKREV